MQQGYPFLGYIQPKTLSETENRDLGTFRPMAERDEKGFGDRVAARRKKLGVSQAALAKAVGMKQQGIANLEKGLVERPRRLMELAEALQTTEKWLLFREGPEALITPNAAEEIAALAHSIHNK
jgi:DNA-binding XRE family transcriptional regulator